MQTHDAKSIKECLQSNALKLLVQKAQKILALETFFESNFTSRNCSLLSNYESFSGNLNSPPKKPSLGYPSSLLRSLFIKTTFSARSYDSEDSMSSSTRFIEDNRNNSLKY